MNKRDFHGLVKALQASKPEDRDRAAEALVQLSVNDATRALIAGLEQGNSRAARVLGERGDIDAIPSLCQALENPEMSVHQEARAALVVLGAVDALRDVFLKSTVPQARKMAFAALEQLVPSDLEELATLALEDPDKSIRSLGEHRGAEPRLLNSEDKDLRLSAVWALSMRGLENELPELITALQDPVDHIRILALHGLAHTWESSDWTDAEGATDIVLPRLKDESPQVRAAACDTLGRMGLGLLELREVLVSSEAIVADAASLALAKHGDKASIPNLGIHAESGSWAAVRALGQIGDPVAIPILEKALKNPELAGVAAQALGELGDVAAIPILENFLLVGSNVQTGQGEPTPVGLAKHALEGLRS